MYPAYKNGLARAWLPVKWIDVRAASPYIPSVGPQKKNFITINAIHMSKIIFLILCKKSTAPSGYYSHPRFEPRTFAGAQTRGV